MKHILCLLGLHEWHEHTVHSPAYPNNAPDGCSSAGITRDLICLRCDHESRRASLLYERDAKRKARGVEAERRLRESAGCEEE